MGRSLYSNKKFTCRRERLKKILSIAKQKAEEAEVFIKGTNSTITSFKNNQLNYIKSEAGKGIGLRVIKNGKIGFTASTEVTNPTSFVNRALNFSNFGRRVNFSFPHLSIDFDSNIKIFDPKVSSLDLENVRETGKEIVEEIKSAVPGSECNVNVIKVEEHITITNSWGYEGQYDRTKFRIDIGVIKILNNDILCWSKDFYSCDFRPIRGIGTELKRKFKIAEKVVPVFTQNSPVILSPFAVAACLLLNFAYMLERATILKSESPLHNKMGKKLFDKKIELYDDATASMLPCSAPFDDEGVSSQKTTIVQNGELQGVIYDIESAALRGLRSTGNGIRSRWWEPPRPHITNLVLQKGENTLGDMIKDVRRGFLIESCTGHGQETGLSGKFLVDISTGYKIENGEITGRIKNAMLMGNLHEAFNHVITVGKESKNECILGYNFYVPPVLFEDFRVISKGR
jgi:PmbA protein